MNEVFRFLFLRPPVPGKAVTVTPSAEFADELAGADSASNRKTALKAVANSLVLSERGLRKLSDLILGDALVAIEKALAAWDDPTSEQVAAAVNEAFGAAPSSIVGSTEFGQDRDRLADNLLAAKLLSRDGAVEARQMEAMLRLMAVIERVAADDEALQEAGAVRAALQRPTLIGQAIAAPSRDLPEEEPPEESERPAPRVESLREEIKTLEDLTKSLTHARPESFFVPAERVTEAPETETSEEETAEDTLRRILIDKIRAGDIEQIQPKVFRRTVKTLRALDISSSAREDAGEIRAPVPRLTLTRNAAEALPEPQRRALALLGLDLTEISAPSALTRITGELTQLHTQLASLEARKSTVTRIGSYLVEADKLAAGIATSPFAPTVPTTHAKVKPVGVGDLLIVREQLKRYQGGEVGHIENILQGEFKKREHLRRRETEETVTVETETKEEEERDSQTTERFELQMEASQVVKEDSSFKAGLAVSGSYGPTVEFKASTDFAMNNSKEESAQTATNYAKEVTNRASSKVSERHREERIMRTLEVFEERNEHGMDNTGTDGHVVGVYQWVDKVYEAQVFNYGKRMMFDVMAPEPAAFWILANTQNPMPGATLEKPTPFTKSHKDINEANYGDLVKRYEVIGVKPPPEPYITVSKTFEGVSPKGGPNGETKVAEVPIPDGYQAVKANLLATANHWNINPGKWVIMVAVGRSMWKRNHTSEAYVERTLHNEQGSIPLAISTFAVSTWMTTVEIDCQRTGRAYEAWQLETQAAIQQAYLKLERDYNEELTALEVRAGIEVQGRNPVENRMIERAELKKHAISFFTAQHYDLFGAITQSPEGYPQTKLAEAEAEGRYIRFFEQAFEWEHMMYLFYPYFWGRKARWALQVLLQDVDPQFVEFLKAGAARIVVPVRLGFEAAIAHFMDTGEIWEGADPPTLTSPLYVSIIDEIKERTDAPGSELPQGDPWEIKLPTTLVKLRPDNSLPTWSKQPDGSWLEN